MLHAILVRRSTHGTWGPWRDLPPSQRAITEVRGIVGSYLREVYGRVEGPGRVPYFADPARVGPFAVDLEALKARDNDAVFRLLVLMGLYQSRRDVDIMELQRTMPVRAATALLAPQRLRVLVTTSRCERLRDAVEFDQGCDVRRDFDCGTATCHRARTPCHVKESTLAIRRMGNMGMLPTSAWLHWVPAAFAAGSTRHVRRPRHRRRAPSC